MFTDSSSDNTHSISKPVPSTSHDMSESECVPSDSSDCVEKDVSKPASEIESKREGKKVLEPVTERERLLTALCDLNEVANLFAACSCP